ncbi:MAG: uncharacterized protein KVP18_003132 [Porospora cf. gigantea A]|uniref:uncharacterized protein n=1 Tax=Porospora cf. gigantea A TaxID=2853593 RepID=UPI003559F41E|nr:MAG: hypothetical protein KVP18_003132 [Porospora cf. gigantea A]
MRGVFLVRLLALCSATLLKVTEKTWKQEVLDADQPVFLMITAEWCGHCKRLLPQVDTMLEMVSKQDTPAARAVHEGHFKFVQVDHKEHSVMGDLGVRSFPSLFYVSRSGERMAFPAHVPRQPDDMLQFLQRMEAPTIASIGRDALSLDDYLSEQWRGVFSPEAWAPDQFRYRQFTFVPAPTHSTVFLFVGRVPEVQSQFEAVVWKHKAAHSFAALPQVLFPRDDETRVHEVFEVPIGKKDGLIPLSPVLKHVPDTLTRVEKGNFLKCLRREAECVLALRPRRVDGEVKPAVVGAKLLNISADPYKEMDEFVTANGFAVAPEVELRTWFGYKNKDTRPMVALALDPETDEPSEAWYKAMETFVTRAAPYKAQVKLVWMNARLWSEVLSRDYHITEFPALLAFDSNSSMRKTWWDGSWTLESFEGGLDRLLDGSWRSKKPITKKSLPVAAFSKVLDSLAELYLWMEQSWTGTVTGGAILLSLVTGVMWSLAKLVLFVFEIFYDDESDVPQGGDKEAKHTKDTVDTKEFEMKKQAEPEKSTRRVATVANVD